MLQLAKMHAVGARGLHAIQDRALPGAPFSLENANERVTRLFCQAESVLTSRVAFKFTTEAWHGNTGI